MNPFLNPIFITRAIKGYITDINRLRRLNENQLKKYKDKQFRKLVRYAYRVPLYYKKYREASVYPNDIKGIEDIEKLPFITKDDLRKNFPNGIVPRNFDKEKAFKISTSGSTGKPVTIYRDQYSIIDDLFRYIRELREYKINWRKHRITIISDLAPNAIGSAHLSFSLGKKKKVPFLSSNNFQIIDIHEDVENIIKKIDMFKPELIIGYPDILQGLSILKQKGFGKGIKPICIQSTGAVISKDARKYIEETFECEIFDSYSSTEAGPTIFECREHRYHIHEDAVHLEFIDENMEPVEIGKSGNVVITRLSFSGTPIIRYTGIDDIINTTDEKCDCGIISNLVDSIIGRSIDTIILPEGKIVPPLSLTGIPSYVMQHFKIDIIKQFQIIQRKLDEIEVLIVINKECELDIDIDIIIKELEKRFREKLGEDIDVKVREVDNVEKSFSRGRVIKQVVSLVDNKLN